MCEDRENLSERYDVQVSIWEAWRDAEGAGGQGGVGRMKGGVGGVRGVADADSSGEPRQGR